MHLDRASARIAQVRVKRWGKSPPRSGQPGRHGKPRVVQGQIGGEAGPGLRLEANSVKRASRTPISHLGQPQSRKGLLYQPSGRPLESRREPRPRGMIAAAIFADRIRLIGPSADLFLYAATNKRCYLRGPAQAFAACPKVSVSSSAINITGGPPLEILIAWAIVSFPPSDAAHACKASMEGK
jgi:hypothetical protein